MTIIENLWRHYDPENHTLRAGDTVILTDEDDDLEVVRTFESIIDRELYVELEDGRTVNHDQIKEVLT